MNGLAPSGIGFQDRHYGSAAGHGIAQVELHNDFLIGVVDKGIPGRAAIDRFEVAGVIMIAAAHAVHGQLISQVVHLFGQCQPVIVGRAIQPGDDDIFVAHGLIQAHGLGQGIGLHPGPAGVPAAADQPGLFQQSSIKFRTELRVTGKFHSGVAHFFYRPHGSQGVSGELFAY